MNNNFDELILKRRTRGRARTASIGVHISRGAKGGRESLGGADGGRVGRGARTAVGRLRARPPLEARMGHARPRATWLVGARTYAPSNGGAHVSSEEGINGVTLLISRCQVFSSLLLA
jgi:hypothetical protein